MPANQSGVFSIQQFSDAGVLLVGGRLYTYAQGTTTQKTAYTEPTATTSHTYTSDGAGGQYIALNARGELPAPLYFTSGDYDLVLKTSTGSTIWTRRTDAGYLSGSFSHSTATTAGTIGAKLQQVVSVKDAPYNATGDGTTNDTALIQSALTAMTQPSALLFPATPNGGFYKTMTTTLTVNGFNGQSLVGQGRRVSRLKQTTAGVALIDFGRAWATRTNGSSVEKMYLSTNVAALRAVDLEGVNNGSIKEVYIEGAFTQGLYINDSLGMTIDDVHLDGNVSGIVETGGANTGPNGYRITNSTFDNMTNYGLTLYQASGFAFNGNTVEACLLGGMLITTAGGGIEINASYFEENYTPAGGGAYFDLSLGSASYQRGVEVHANYFNGRTAGATYDYYPVRLKFADGHHYHDNFINVGNRFINFTSGGTVVNCIFGQNAYSSAFTLTDPSTVYGTIPAEFLTNNNRIEDYAVIPTDAGNFLFGSTLTAWTHTSGGAGSSWNAADKPMNGTYGGILARTTNSSSISRTIAVGAIANNRARSRYVTFGIDCSVADATGKNFTLTLGDGVTTATKLFNMAVADRQARKYISLLCGSAITTLTLTVTLDSATTSLSLANESLFVGMNPHAAEQTTKKFMEFGSFTCAAAATTTVTDITAGMLPTTALIQLIPTNASAATLMAGATMLWVSTITANTSFVVSTANGGGAAGTETFKYIAVY